MCRIISLSGLPSAVRDSIHDLNDWTSPFVDTGAKDLDEVVSEPEVEEEMPEVESESCGYRLGGTSLFSS